MQDRRALLEEIFRLDHPEDLEGFGLSLRKIGWDSPDGEVITLREDIIISILQRYLSGALSSIQVEDWANLVEAREDISYGTIEQEGEMIDEVIFILANPALEGELTPQGAQALIKVLRRQE